MTAAAMRPAPATPIVPSPQFGQRLGRWGLLLLASIFTIAVARSAASLTWSLLGQTGTQILDVASAFAQPKPGRAIETAPILKLAPFGTVAAPVVAQAAAKATSLGFVLQGVAVSGHESSTAVISVNAGRPQIYGIGDTIDGRATVLEITSGKVMLKVGDGVEFLSFPEPGQQTSGVARIVAGIPNAGIPGPGIASSAVTSPGVAGSGIAGPGAPGTAVVPQQPVRNAQTPILEEYRRRIAQNPQSLLDSVGLSVSPDGYKVGANATSTILGTGLQSGDLVSKVNGQSVGNIENDRQLFDKIVASGQVKIEVMRRGRPILMSFPLK